MNTKHHDNTREVVEAIDGAIAVLQRAVDMGYLPIDDEVLPKLKRARKLVR